MIFEENDEYGQLPQEDRIKTDTEQDIKIDSLQTAVDELNAAVKAIRDAIETLTEAVVYSVNGERGQVTINNTTLGAQPLLESGVTIKTVNDESLLGSGNINIDPREYNVATTTTDGLMSSTDKVKLNGIASGAEVNVQADWNVSDSTSDAYIKNKPTIPAAQVNADWNAVNGLAKILNKPEIPAAQVNTDWNAVSGKAQILNTPTLAAVASSGSYTDLTNKPSIPAAQVNADWNAVSGKAQILNKPTIPAAQVNSDWNANSGKAQILNKPVIPEQLKFGNKNILSIAQGENITLTESSGVLTIKANAGPVTLNELGISIV